MENKFLVALKESNDVYTTNFLGDLGDFCHTLNQKDFIVLHNNDGNIIISTDAILTALRVTTDQNDKN